MRHVRWGGAALVLLAVLAGCGSSPDEVGDPPVERVLVVSLPGVSWNDLRHYDLPNLERLAASSAIGDLSTRIGRSDAAPTDAYLTLGAGTRAIAPLIDRAVALDPDEKYGGVSAADIGLRRRGSVPDGIFYLAIGEALDTNDNSSFGARVGLLGARLHDAGVRRAVIANADATEGFVSEEPPPEGSYARSAATTLMDPEGLVPDGTVGRDLLKDDPDAPFGRRLDPDAVLSAFDDVWEPDGRVVALVEASDLLRAAAYGPRATASQRSALRRQALEDADALLGRLLDRVDPEQDAVVVVSPVAPGGASALGVATLQAPGIDSGLLESPTTRRAGYVQLADVNPTILELLGEDTPDDIEGRGFTVAERGIDARDRIVKLDDSADAARFRDRMLPVVVGIVTAIAAVLAWFTRRRDRLRPVWRRQLIRLAYFMLGIVPATFIFRQFEWVPENPAAYLAFVLWTALLYVMLCEAAEQFRPGLGPIAAVGGIVGLIFVDVVFGAPMQLNTVFGYSVGIAGRFAGLGNLAFALFGAATMMLAVLIAERHQSRGQWVALVLLVAVVLLEGLPMLGADVGGVLSMVPAFAITALLLSGRRITLQALLIIGVSTVAALLAFAFIDAVRAQQQQTHLARLAEHIVDGRWGPFFDSLTRRWQASFGGAELAGWLAVVTILVATGVYVTLVAQGRIGRVGPRWDRGSVAGAAGLGVLALVGLVANDSSVAVPLTMLIVVVPVVALRALHEPQPQ
jgi:hypothetical protein